MRDALRQRVGARNKSAHDEESGTPATPTLVARGLVPRVYPLGPAHDDKGMAHA
jgi:hypothetical protein